MHASRRSPGAFLLTAALVLCAPQSWAQEQPAEPDLAAELSAAFRAQGAFRARVRYESETLGVKGLLDLAYEPERRRLLVIKTQSAPAQPKVSLRFDAGRMSAWGEGIGAPTIMRYDLEPLVEALYPLVCLLEELRGAEAPTPESFRASLGPELGLLVSRNEEGRPDLDIGVGLSLHPAAWLSGLRAGEGRILSADAARVRLEVPAKGFTLVIDRKTGFFQEQRVALAEGSFSLTTESLEPLDAFPADQPPPGEERALSLELFEGLTSGLTSGLLGGLSALSLEGEDEQRRLVQACQAFAAARSHVRRQHVLRGLALSAVNQTLRKRSLAELRAQLPALARACEERAAREVLPGLERSEETLMDRFTLEVLEALPEDSPCRTGIRKALAPEQVRARRAPDLSFEVHVDAILKEHEARAKQK